VRGFAWFGARLGGAATPTSFAARCLLALSVVVASLALGAIDTPVLCVVAALVGVSALCAWLSGTVAHPRTAATLLLFAAVALTGYTLLQIVPLPMRVLQTVAPANADIWQRALQPLRAAGPAFAPISLDPSATRVEFLRGALYTAAFLAGLRLSSRREGTLFLIAAIALSAVVLGIAALLHPTLGAERVFGIYHPTANIRPRHIAPILNPNALAAYLNIGLLLALGEGLTPRSPVPRPIPLAIAAVLMGFQFWVGSRAGIATMVVGALLVVWLTYRGRQTRNASRITYGIGAFVAVASTAMWVFAISDDAWEEVADTNLSKVRLYTQVVDMIRAFPIFGAGRGSFESTFPAFRQGTGHVVYTHPENLILQWATEWGVPVAVAGLGIIVWCLRPSVVLARAHSCFGAWAAIVAVFLQNLADLNSEFPAVVLALAICAGIITGGSGIGKGRRDLAWTRRPRLVALTSGGAIAFGILAAITTTASDLQADRDRLHTAALAKMPLDEFHDLARNAMLRHPAEPYLPFTGALRASSTHDDSVLPWAARTLERAPVFGPAHVVIARSLFRVSPSQARLEYRIAFTQAPELAPLAPETVPLIAGPTEALELVPDGSAGLLMLQALAFTTAQRLPASQWAVDDEALRRKNDLADVVDRQARQYAADVTELDGAPWCTANERPACVQLALSSARRLQQILPTDCRGYELEARVVAAGGDLEGALHRLESSAQQVVEPIECFATIVQLAKRTQNERRITGAIDRLSQLGCSTGARCTAPLLRAAQAEAERGNLQRSLLFLRRALDRDPTDDALSAAGGTASRLGLHAEAMQDYSELAKRYPDTPDWRDAVVRERQALLGERESRDLR
jgi:tetratricopeptide (TPR) repeat protein